MSDNLETIVLAILHRTGYFRDAEKLCAMFRRYEKDMKVFQSTNIFFAIPRSLLTFDNFS